MIPTLPTVPIRPTPHIRALREKRLRELVNASCADAADLYYSAPFLYWLAVREGVGE